MDNLSTNSYKPTFLYLLGYSNALAAASPKEWLTPLIAPLGIFVLRFQWYSQDDMSFLWNLIPTLPPDFCFAALPQIVYTTPTKCFSNNLKLKSSTDFLRTMFFYHCFCLLIVLLLIYFFKPILLYYMALLYFRFYHIVLSYYYYVFTIILGQDRTRIRIG